MPVYHLAQLNIAVPLAPVDSQQLKDFVDNLDPINALAECSPGFVWRLKDDSGNATSFRPFGDDILANMSVWESIDSLKQFVYDSGHVEFMRRRAEWFSRMKEAYTVLWWVPAGHLPDFGEAKERLDSLREKGPGEFAFTFGKPFPMPLD